MINWIDHQARNKKPGTLDRLLALLEDLPTEWDANERDRLRAAILYKLGVLGDPKAIPVLEIYAQRGPEGAGFEVEDPESGEKGRGWYHFDGAAKASIAHLRFQEAYRAARNDEERADVCIEELLRVARGGGDLPTEVGGLELLVEGRERYLPQLREATRRLPPDSVCTVVQVMDHMIRREHSAQLEQTLLDVAEERTDRVAAYALVVLQRHGTPASLPTLEQIARRNEPERRQSVTRAIDAIRWRQILEETAGKPSVDQLRWALDRHATTEDARKLIKERQDWPLEEIRRGALEMGVTGRLASIEILRAMATDPERRADALRLAHELSTDERSDTARGLSIALIAEFGTADDRAILAERADRLRDRQRSGSISDREYKELNTLENALRLLGRPK